MSLAFRCPCGNLVAVPLGSGNGGVKCPRCGRTTRAQTMQIPWRWLLVSGVIVLLIGAGLTYLIRALQNADAGNPPEDTQVAHKPAPRTDLKEKPKKLVSSAKPSVLGTKNSRRPTPHTLEEPLKEKPNPEPPDVPSLPKQVKLKPSKPPVVRIHLVEPAQPQTDGSLTLYLTAEPSDESGLQYQYRLSPGAIWQPAPDGRVKLTNLKSGVLKLEVRVLDKQGRPSPVVTRSWTIKPIPQPKPKVQLTLQEGDKFYQEVVITRLSSYRFLGAEIKQNTQYGFLSSFQVQKRKADGGMVVLQKVETARFAGGDPAMQALLNGVLQKTKGANFKITLDAQRHVTKFEGAGDGINVFAGKNALAGQTFLLWSFLDRDAWKELAQTTLFRPEKPAGTAAKWTRPMTHSWGPLGSWTGRVVYGYTGKKARMDRIGYVLDMAYQPPGKGAGGGLPFKIMRAVFKPQTAAGTILFDAGKDRVAAAEERFHVKGILAITALGVDSVIDMDEAQIFRLRVLEQKPGKK
jgi:hypothetical protein